MRTEEEIRRVAWASKSEAETLDNPVSVRVAMASRAAQLFWVLGDAHSTALQMEMELTAAELNDTLKTVYAPLKTVRQDEP